MTLLGGLALSIAYGLVLRIRLNLRLSHMVHRLRPNALVYGYRLAMVGELLVLKFKSVFVKDMRDTYGNEKTFRDQLMMGKLFFSLLIWE